MQIRNRQGPVRREWATFSFPTVSHHEEAGVRAFARVCLACMFRHTFQIWASVA